MARSFKLIPGKAVYLTLAVLLSFPAIQGMAAKPYSIPVALEGIVTLQGRPAPPSPSWSVPLTVDFYLAGNTFIEASFDVTTDQNGMFTIADTGLDPGNYVVAVKNSHTLQVAYAATLSEGSNVIDFGSLPEGDANDDNTVTIVDFSILSTTFNRSVGDAGYDGRADFNEDNIITISDFSLLSTNFGMSGYEVSASSYDDLIASQGGRFVGTPYQIPFYGKYIEGRLQDIKSSDVAMHLSFDFQSDENTLIATVKLNSEDQAFDAAMTALQYDIHALEVLSIRHTDRLPLVLLEKADEGQLFFAAGALSNLPEGSIDFVTIEFQVKGVLSKNAVSLSNDNNAATFAGQNILGEVSEDEWNIRCEPCDEPFQMYPNPGTGIFHLQAAGSDEVRLTVMDSRGMILKEIKLTNIQSNQTIDLTGLPSGLYLIRSETETSRSMHRIIKE